MRCLAHFFSTRRRKKLVDTIDAVDVPFLIVEVSVRMKHNNMALFSSILSFSVAHQYKKLLMHLIITLIL